MSTEYEFRTHVTAMTPKHADDIAAVHMDVIVSLTDKYLSVSRLLSIAQARELSLDLARAADKAELALPE